MVHIIAVVPVLLSLALLQPGAAKPVFDLFPALEEAGGGEMGVAGSSCPCPVGRAGSCVLDLKLVCRREASQGWPAAGRRARRHRRRRIREQLRRLMEEQEGSR
jgi:hypothetical protein